MATTLNVVTPREKVFLILELIFIVFFFIMTMIELISILKMYTIYIKSQDYYYFYLIHNRLQIKEYNSFIKASSLFEQSCPSYPNSTHKIHLSYVPRKFLSIGSFSKVDLKNITDSVQVYEGKEWDMNPPKERIIQNNTIANKNYWEFDLQSLGNSTIDLMTNYIFNVWKGVYMCVLKMEYEPNAYWIIPKDNNIKITDYLNQNDHCADYTGDKSSQSCGYYYDTYQTCSILTYTKINSSMRVTDFDYNAMTNEPSWSCPFNYFYMNLTYNENYNFSDPKSLEVNGTEYSQFNNYVEDKYKTDPNYQTYLNMIDKYFLFDLDNAFLGSYKEIKSANDTYTIDDKNLNTYEIKGDFGMKDSFMGVWDTYPFVDLYNDTYYWEPVNNPITKKSTYLPYFFKSYDDSNYYLPVDRSPNKVNITLTYWGLPTVTKECFKNYIQPNKKWQWFLHLSQMKTDFLDDNLPLLLAWVFVKLFISFFWQFCIRFALIIDKIRRGKNYPADVKSDFITRYTSKAVTIIVFALLFFGVLYQKNYFNRVFDFSNSMIKYNCYNDKLIIDSIKLYQKYVEDLNSNNDLLLFTLYSSLFTEVVTLFLFFLDHYILYRTENEEKEKENLLVQQSKKTN